MVVLAIFTLAVLAHQAQVFYLAVAVVAQDFAAQVLTHLLTMVAMVAMVAVVGAVLLLVVRLAQAAQALFISTTNRYHYTSLIHKRR
jgi:hypothetical protein